jgi:hypothetical protein
MKWNKIFGSPQILKVLHNPSSMCFFSFLIGFGIVILILHRPMYTEKRLSLSVEDVESKVVRNGGKCYKFRAEDTKCEKVYNKE